MTDDDILAALDIPLCGWCPTYADVQFSWDKPCGHTSRRWVCEGHVPLFLEQAAEPARLLCRCGVWAVYRLDDCLQVAAVTR
jgi:hypothetical protein